MVRCVVLDDYQQVATSYAAWSSLGVELVVASEHLAGRALLDLLRGAEVVVVMRERTPLDRDLIARLPDLRLVVTTGMRNASIDLAACAEHGITVCGTSSRATPTPELTWALVHGLTRHLLLETTHLRDGGPWQSSVGTDLAGATMGLLGVGRIGTRVAAVARAFDMDVVAWSPHLTEERALDAGVRRVEKHDLFACADIVSIHLVLSESTRGIVGAPELSAMRPSAYLVNTSRAALVDTGALLTALDTDAIAGVGLDVWDVEPVPADDPLARHPKVLGTPHLGYVTHDNYTVFFTEAVEDVAAWLAGAPVRVLG